MEANDSIVLEVRCKDEDCGMVSPYRFWRDGSFKRILDCCYHAKRLPTSKRIVEEFEREKNAKRMP